MKNTPRWHRKRSRRLLAKEYSNQEGGPWLAFPWKYGNIRVPTFLSHIEFGEESGKILFDYGGIILVLHSLKFIDPFQGHDGDRNIFDAGIWKKTNFVTGWRDEFEVWSKA